MAMRHVLGSNSGLVAQVWPLVRSAIAHAVNGWEPTASMAEHERLFSSLSAYVRKHPNVELSNDLAS